MKLNKQKTAKIFEILRKGKFLNANSPIKEEALLFEYVENNYNELQEYFSYININLQLGQGYCYFASMENKDKLNTILELIDIVNFLYEVDMAFGVGYRFFYSNFFTTKI